MEICPFLLSGHGEDFLMFTNGYLLAKGMAIRGCSRTEKSNDSLQRGNWHGRRYRGGDCGTLMKLLRE